MNIRSYQLQSSKYIAEFLGPIINFYELYEWCDQTFGPRGDGQRWQKDIGIGYGGVEFVQEEDLCLFLLKWS